MTLDQFFDYLGDPAERAKGRRAKESRSTSISPIRTKQFVLVLANSVLNHLDGTQAKDADATLTLERLTLNKILLRELTMPEMCWPASAIKITGKVASVGQLFGLLDTFDPWFPLVTPPAAAR